MLQKIIDVLDKYIIVETTNPEGGHWSQIKSSWVAQEILALKYQIARELYEEWETTLVVDGDGNVLEGLSFHEWLDQRENNG